jgi:hypothetical protein
MKSILAGECQAGLYVAGGVGMCVAREMKMKSISGRSCVHIKRG